MSSVDRYLDHFRRNVLPGLRDCTASVMISHAADETDVKFCLELGASIMLGKPIIAFVAPGRECPPGLRKVADAIVHDDEELRAALERLGMPMATHN